MSLPFLLVLFLTRSRSLSIIFIMIYLVLILLTVQALTPADLEGMAQETGFDIVDRTDGPHLVAFDPKASGRYVLWLRKPAV